jgi:hypothetical protein
LPSAGFVPEAVGATGFLASGGQHPAKASSQNDEEIARFIAVA